MNTKTAKTAIYPGTFDPITRGHEDLVKRASQIFDHVIVGIAESLPKKPFFSLEERIVLAQDVLATYPNVQVLGFTGLLMDFVQAHDAQIILRGLRAVSDFEFEFQMAGMNRRLHPSIETVFLTPGEDFLFVSATMVREIALLGGNVEQFVQANVVAAFGRKLGKT